MRLKATWTVSRGVIPGKADEVVRFHYTEDEFAADCARPPGPALTRFAELEQQARDRQAAWTDPRVTNWVRCDFIWY